jgi:WD40 repeat protein
LLKTLNGHEGAVNSVQFSPDGKLIASGSLDHTVKIWNVETGNLIETLIGHEGAVNSIMFSPDGSRLISGSSDRKIKVWRRNGLRISSGSSDQDSEAEISLFRSLLGFLLN